MERSKRNKRREIKPLDRWPVTYRLAAMGTLLAYSAIGATKVAIGSPLAEHKNDGTPSGPQALAVRRFQIASGTLGETFRAWMRFAHTGEAGGAAGQSIAAAALGGVFLAYTGISMALRRYLAWRPKSKAPAA